MMKCFTELLAEANPDSDRGPPKRAPALYPCNSIGIHPKYSGDKIDETVRSFLRGALATELR